MLTYNKYPTMMNESPPKISVVVPVYNASKYLAECLDSICAQGVDDIEIICINDGSTDDSLQKLKQYAEKDNRFKIIDVPNGGYGKAMNLGLNAAKGKYFAIVEPDAYLQANAYKWMLETAEKHSLDFVKGEMQSFYENEKGEKVMGEKTSNAFYNEILCIRNCIQRFFGLMPATVCGLYNVEFLNKYNIRYNETPGASYQDVGFFIQTFTHADRAMFKEGLVYLYRRDNPASSSNTIGGKPYAMRDEYTLTKAKLEKYPERWERMKKFYLFRRMRSHRWMFASIRNSVKKEYLDDFRKELIDLEDINRDALSGYDKRTIENLMISTDYFLHCEELQLLQDRILRRVSLMSVQPQIIRNIKKYKIMRAITFGKVKRKYTEKLKLAEKTYAEISSITKSFIHC